MFNNGDKVICVDAFDCFLTKGKEYTVGHATGAHVDLINDHNIIAIYRNERFQLVPKIKVGDTVRCLKPFSIPLSDDEAFFLGLTTNKLELVRDATYLITDMKTSGPNTVVQTDGTGTYWCSIDRFELFVDPIIEDAKNLDHAIDEFTKKHAKNPKMPVGALNILSQTCGKLALIK